MRMLVGRNKTESKTSDFKNRFQSIAGFGSMLKPQVRRMVRRLLWCTGGVVLALNVGIIGLSASAMAQANSANNQTKVGAASVVPASSQETYLGNDLKTCALCHEKEVKSFLNDSPMAEQSDPNTPMGMEGSDRVCEVCHGPSREHAMYSGSGKRPPPPVVFGRNAPTSAKKQNEVCLTCHTDSNHIHWAGSPHQFAGLSCASCHTVHGKDLTLSKRTVAKVCFACHTDIRADAHKAYSHPILEGEVTCISCHNPHGGSGGPHQLRYLSINETCYSCHADKRGPFLYEHPPVEEKCTTCHNPHGTSFAFMLRRPVPFLCQQCHMAPWHISQVYGPNSLASGAAAPQLLGRGCLNCHSHIHGSNDPNGGRWLH